MRVLLDTHAFLWAVAEPSRLGRQLPLVEDPATSLVVSAASAWEIAIKWSIGRLPLPEDPRHFVPARVSLLDAELLSVEHGHALAVADLPRHHADPFDRLLVVQSQALSLPLLSADQALRPYDVQLLTP